MQFGRYIYPGGFFGVFLFMKKNKKINLLLVSFEHVKEIIGGLFGFLDFKDRILFHMNGLPLGIKASWVLFSVPQEM